MNLLIITQKVDKNYQLLGFFIDWIERFSKKFDKVTVLCLESGEYKLPENVRVISLGKDRKLPKIVWPINFYKEIIGNRKNYDAVFIHMNPVWMVLGGPVWRLLNKKTFFWYTSGGVTTKLKLAEKFADKIFTASKESFRIKSDKVIVTGHGVDTTLFAADLSKRSDNFKILSIGRIAKVKNYETLINAAKILKDKGVDFSVTIIGEPAITADNIYEQEIKALIGESGLNGNFKFLGKMAHRELIPYYQSHNLFVHLSKTGSLDKTILEAMSCNMDVLSSNDAAKSFLPPELVFKEDDPQDLSDKIISIYNGNLHYELGDFVVKNHNLDDLINNISVIIKR